MQKQCTVDLWTAGYAGSRLTASARSPMDKPWTTLCVAHRLPTGRQLPTSSTVLKPIVIKSGKVKTKTPAPALAYSSPVAVQTTGTTAEDARQESISLARESGATTIKGRLNGREYVDYQLQAYAGQTLLVSLAASNGQTYFNLNPPGSELSMFVGSTSGKRFKTLLPADGIYTVRVYLMRAAARRHESSRYTVKFNLTGKPLAPRPAHSDALIPGTPFHASPTQSN